MSNQEGGLTGPKGKLPESITNKQKLGGVPWYKTVSEDKGTRKATKNIDPDGRDIKDLKGNIIGKIMPNMLQQWGNSW